MGFELRPYQKEAVDAGLKFLTGRSKKPGIIVAPCGSGKSLLISKIAHEINRPTLVLQPSKEILEQNYAKATSFGSEPTIYSASCGKKELSSMTYATLKSIKKDVARLKDIGIDTLLIDECFTGDVEILTEKGFTQFNKLEQNVRVAQYDKGFIDFVTPIRYINKPHDGDICLLHIKHGIDLPVTKNHDFLFYDKKYGKWYKQKISEASFKYGKCIPVSGISRVNNGEDLLSDMERLFIATQADGNIHVKNDNDTIVSFSFSKERKIKRIHYLCKNANVEIWEVKRKIGKGENTNNKRRFMVRMPKFTTKDIRNHISFPMSYEKARSVIEECSLWDGSIIGNTMLYYSSTDKTQVDFYNSVATIAGHGCYVSIEKDDRKETYSDVYRLFITKDKKLRGTNSMYKRYEKYTGQVYCVEVPSGCIVLRYKGYTFVSGNCHAGYSPEEGSEFMEFMSEFPQAKVLGFTATPCRLRAYSSMLEGNYSKLNMLTKDEHNFFKKLVHVIQIQELTSQGFWCPLKYERWSFDESALMLNSTGAEYTNESIKESIVRNGLNNSIYKRLLQLMNERKAILVCMDSIESCNRISEFMNARMGAITGVVTSLTTKKKREQIISDFKEGKLKVVFNYSTLATGFDFPELDCVMFGRPTFSYSTYYQILGRAVRIHPDKKEALIVDCCDNMRRFGRIEDLTIEQFPSKGWCMFAGDQLLSNIRMGDIITKDEILRRAASLKSVNGDGRREDDLDSIIMWFGKYEGIRFKDIPVSYFRFLAENMAVKPGDRKEKIIEYYNKIKA